jgi:two-component system, OmpR family, response regulator VicR
VKTILIIEDDARIAAALEVRLKAAGYRVLISTDGHHGVLAAASQNPDLIISDIWMPKPIGFLGGERRRFLGLEHVPVIYITGSKKKDLRQIAIEEGAAGFFEKPYDARELLAAVADTLAQQPLAATQPAFDLSEVS